jgi:hypothetical protein
MNSFDEQLFELIGRSLTSKSKTAAVVTPCQMIVSDNLERNYKSKAASIPAADKVRVIVDFINQRY